MTTWGDIKICSICGKNKGEYQCKDGILCPECIVELSDEIKNDGPNLTVEEIKNRILEENTPKATPPHPPTIIPRPQPQPQINGKKMLCGFAIFIVVMCGLITVVCLSQAGETKTAFDDPVYYDEIEEDYEPEIAIDVMQYDGMSDEDLFAVLGKPDSVDFWDYTLGNNTYPVSSVVFGNMEFMIMQEDNTVARLTFHEADFSYENTDNILFMFGLWETNQTVIQDQNVSYRASKCPIPDFWIYDMDDTTINGIKVTYIDFNNYSDVNDLGYIDNEQELEYATEGSGNSNTTAFEYAQRQYDEEIIKYRIKEVERENIDRLNEKNQQPQPTIPQEESIPVEPPTQPNEETKTQIDPNNLTE